MENENYCQTNRIKFALNLSASNKENIFSIRDIKKNHKGEEKIMRRYETAISHFLSILTSLCEAHCFVCEMLIRAFEVIRHDVHTIVTTAA